MILYRYLVREVLLTTLAVSSVLLLIILGSRFARYLSRAASGRLSLDALGQLTLLYLPYAAQMILPLSFTLGVMLTFGRLYSDSEMAVIQASGVGQRKLLVWILSLALLMTGITGVISLQVAPMARGMSETLLQAQGQQTGFESVTPGQFTRLGERILYASGLSEDAQTLERLFLVQPAAEGETLITAERAFQQLESATSSRYLVLQEGQQYELPVDDLQMNELGFARYALRLGSYQMPDRNTEASRLPLLDLLAQGDEAARIELAWRLALPLMVPIMLLIALPLTQARPRQGRFMTLLPVLLVQMVFLTGLMSLQESIVKGNWPAMPGLWPVLLLFLAFGLLLCRLRGVFVR